MALKFHVDSLDNIDDGVKSLYAASDSGGYVLQVEGAVPKKKVDEFRENNIKLSETAKHLESQLEQLKAQYEGVDLEKWREFQETQRKIADKKLIDSGDIDKLFDEKFKRMQSDFEKQKTAMQAQIESMEKDRHHMLVTAKLQKAAAENGVRPTAIEDAMRRGEALFSIKDGNVVAMDGDSVMTDGEGNMLTPESYMKSVLPTIAPHLYNTSSGGGATGNNNASGGGNGALHRSKMTPKAKSEFIQQNGSEAYMKLPV